MKANSTHQLALTTTVDEVTGEIKPLFSFPVQVCKATESDVKTQFDGAAPSGAEYETQYVDTATGETFEYAERLKGIRVGDDFKPIDPEAIKAIDEATKLETMVALGKVDRDAALTQYAERICGRYFLQVPAKGGSGTAYRLTFEALRGGKKGKKVVPATAIVTKRTARSRQKLALIYADENLGCLVMVEVNFAAMIRSPDEQILAHQTAEVEQKMIDQARQVIAAMPDGITAIENEVDEAVALRNELKEKALAGETVDVPTPVAATNSADNLKAVLEASLAQ